MSSNQGSLDKANDRHQTNRSLNGPTSSSSDQTLAAKRIVDLMRHGWKLPSPQLLISVTGGAGLYKLPPRIQSAFQRGLMTAAVTTGKYTNHIEN
jgi:hypothetical protein